MSKRLHFKGLRFKRLRLWLRAWKRVQEARSRSARERDDWLFLMARAPADARVGWNARFVGRNISFGARTYIEDGALLCTRDWQGDRITLGEGCKVRGGAQLHSWGGNISLGDNCSINPLCVFYGTGGITIGNDVRIAAHCSLIASSHKFERTDVPIIAQGQTAQGIVIEDDVWIGAGVRVLDGVRVGRGSILAAGAVVNCDVAPFSVVGGVPARLIKSRLETKPSAEAPPLSPEA